ncbi:DUF6059 family protein [Streptomyces sp. NPDC052196]|uniref:DUF6059 family protein n=1 Tax=Streptomyces sp. NPDC052196 TaxID=3156691 RepID=UPI003416B7FF
MTTRRMLRAVYRAMVAAGRMYVPVLPDEENESPPSDIPYWHPERLRPDIPFSESELALYSQLTTGE